MTDEMMLIKTTATLGTAGVRALPGTPMPSPVHLPMEHHMPPRMDSPMQPP